mmetsp:Transcript_9101/g.14570  ORF Transcript_9101/g.14570 Transcript_9101/m.14570 type:complete len:356 (+) Transcript_9101:124-1191(+)
MRAKWHERFMYVSTLVSFSDVAKGQFTLDQVATHATNDDCWSVLYGTVYDVTAYAPQHTRRGATPEQVYAICGVDGTSLFDSVHGNERNYLEFSSIQNLGPLVEATAPATLPPIPTTLPPTQLPEETVGPLIEATPPPTTPATAPPVPTTTLPPTEPPPETSPPTAPPTAPPTYTPETARPTASSHDPNESDTMTITADELALHDIPGVDCFVVYYGTVYDLSSYNHPDPPGNSVVDMSCGLDGTAAFESAHDKSYLTPVEHLIVGTMLEEEEEVTYDNDNEKPEQDPSSESFSIGDVVSLELLARHNTMDDCWIAYYDSVYDLTDYVHPSPPGNSVIAMACEWADTFADNLVFS